MEVVIISNRKILTISQNTEHKIQNGNEAAPFYNKSMQLPCNFKPSLLPTLSLIFIVFFKELIDALRDRRTLLRLLIPAVLMGPLLLLAISGFISSMQERAEKRELLVVGIEHAPILRNYLERQSYTLKPAPTDYEARLRNTTLLEPVLVVASDSEVEIVTDSSNQRANATVPVVQRLLMGFNQERATIALALKGVTMDVFQSISAQEHDLASAQSRTSRVTAMLPMFIIMAVLYGALTAALDSTAGERERGSLEPLLMNPVPPFALVAGKWLAVALLGWAIAWIACLGFIPAQWFIKNDSLQALFQFGWEEVIAFSLLQLPLAAGFGAVLMALAIRSKTFKEAQASSGLIVTLVGLAPMVSVLNPAGESAWYLWVPGLAQNTLMQRVLKGEALDWMQILPAIGVSTVLVVLCLAYVAKSMRGAVAR
jgi:sodium transport system permease protein